MIYVKDLKKDFGELHVLKGVNQHIAKGEKVVVIGPSGSGKSTFLRCLNLLETPTSGQITFEGVDITSRKCNINAIRQKMGMVFQQFNLFPHLTVRKNITLAPVQLKRMSQEQADARADELLKRVGLYDKADVYPRALSGGQRQRIAIVRALAIDPDVMLFDEPTSALDPEMVRGAGRNEAAGARRHDDGRGHARDGLCARGGRQGAVHGRRQGAGGRHARADIRFA